MADPGLIEALTVRAGQIRRHILAVASTKDSHVGGAMSAADLMTVLFFHFLHSGSDGYPRDHFILSKGHCVPVLHACMVELGAIDASELPASGESGSRLAGHATLSAPGVEFATGSLGHGLGVGVGIALGEKLSGSPARTVVLLGDGELQEGTIWEAALVAPALGLSHLVAIVDANRFQAWGGTEDLVPLEPMADKWKAFGWETLEIDGHSIGAIVDALATIESARRPLAIVARTIKGKGVPEIEGTAAAHFLTATPEIVRSALSALATKG